jgi:UDP-N-acetylmuramoylalanine--D-glutamate ligase
MATPSPARVRRLPRLPREFVPRDLGGRRVMVLGLGTFGGGLGAALHLSREGADVVVADASPAEKLGASLRALEGRGVELALGRNPTGDEVARCDWICASPAVPWSAPPLVEAAKRGIPVESEITLLMRLLPCPSLGITGTNGKSTTTMLAGRTLAAEGRRVWSGGNIGGSLLDSVVEMGSNDAVVLEISSFQLEHLAEVGLGPEVGLVTNVTPDHLDRHGTFEEYAAAKRSILAGARVAVLQAGDAICRRFGAEFGGDVLWFGDAAEFRAGEHGARLRADGVAEWRGLDGPVESDESVEEVDLAPLRLRGVHNRWNLLGAAAAATAFGVRFPAAVRAGFEAEPLARRMNLLGRKRGAQFVDDSVCTSPPALAAALRSFEGPIRLLAGGYDKGIDPAPMVEAMFERCAKVYLYGAVAHALVGKLQGAARDRTGRPGAAVGRPLQWEAFTDLRAAFAAAAREAVSGETILFSPGFASYDQFRNFTERGDLFCALYAELPSP